MTTLLVTPRRIAVARRNSWCVFRSLRLRYRSRPRSRRALSWSVASNTSFRSLQAAVDAASSAAELRVKGTSSSGTQRSSKTL